MIERQESMVMGTGSGVRMAQVQVSAQLFATWVSLGKLLKHSEPRCLHLSMEDYGKTFWIGCSKCKMRLCKCAQLVLVIINGLFFSFESEEGLGLLIGDLRREFVSHPFRVSIMITFL